MLPPPLLSRLGARPGRVVVLRASRIGDYVCATPAFRAVRQAFPEAEITLAGLPLVADLARSNPDIDCFEPFPGWPGIAEQFFEPAGTLQFFARMQRRRFDLAIQLHGSGVFANPATLMLGARFTAGMTRPGDPAGRLDAAFPVPAGLHEVRRLLAFLAFLGIEPRGERLDLPFDQAAHDEAGRLLESCSRPLLGIHAGAREATKRWPAARFGEAARRLMDRRGGTAVLLGEAGDAEGLADALAQRELRDLSGRTSLVALAAVVAHLDLLLANDSGPANMAYALGTPSVTVFGGTSPRRWGPLANGGRHAVVSRRVACPLPDNCLERMDVARVTAAAEQVMRRGRLDLGRERGLQFGWGRTQRKENAR